MEGNKGSSNASNRVFSSNVNSNASSNASSKAFSNRVNKGFSRVNKGFSRVNKGFNRDSKDSKISRVSRVRAFCFSITPILKAFLESSPITPHFQG